MTQEEKQILLKDLCGRLAYGVFIHYHWSREGNTIDKDRELDFSDVETLKYNIENPQNDWCDIFWKPYLRSMSSMTDEEENEYINTFIAMWDAVDWLNAHHFDYRGLIPMGLAFEAPKDMYKTE